MLVELDGSRLRSERDFHEQLARMLDFGPYYGRNLDALWDRLSADVERPVKLVWKDAEVSRLAMGAVFDRIVRILRKVEEQDRTCGLRERFEFELL
ncbi:barstar family protein [Archangium violaceum]|uniref:barstar family protein n=1 Tax=Archangium violaceum TaxID=83451 RepID=UPI00193AEA94|nr:barstar family protein [Archangium violaceum]QRK12081.1 barstar family protein [Archangium violaceum]